MSKFQVERLNFKPVLLEPNINRFSSTSFTYSPFSIQAVRVSQVCQLCGTSAGGAASLDLQIARRLPIKQAAIRRQLT